MKPVANEGVIQQQYEHGIMENSFTLFKSPLELAMNLSDAFRVCHSDLWRYMNLKSIKQAASAPEVGRNAGRILDKPTRSSDSRKAD